MVGIDLFIIEMVTAISLQLSAWPYPQSIPEVELEKLRDLSGNGAVLLVASTYSHILSLGPLA